jgi:hypothetical protein
MANESQTTNTAPVTEAAEATDTTTETQDAAGQTQDAAAQGAQQAGQKKQAKPAKPQSNVKKFKLKVDGQEFEEEFDLSDENKLREELQMAKVSRKRMQEFSELQKEVNTFLEALKSNPRKALSNPNIGVDVKELAARIIEEEIAESRKSPEQLEKERLQAELQQMKEQREREVSEAQAKEMERLKEQEYERIDIQIDQALSKTDLPKEPYVVKKIAEYMLLGYQLGKDVSPEDVLPIVREEILQDIKHLASVMPEDALEEIFGDVIKKVRKSNVAKAKAKVAVGSNKAADIAKKLKQESAQPAKKKTFKEFFGV